MLKNTQQEYGSIAKWLHWLTAIIIFTLLIVGFLMDDIGDKATKGQVYALHKSFGLTVLLLGVVRIAWMSMNPKPGYAATTPLWQVRAARGLHHLLYLLIILMPISGWVMSTAADHTPVWFGLFAMPFPGITPSESLAHFFKETHEFLAWVVIVGVGLHIAAAVKHHFIDKDDILTRMLPKR